MSPMVIPSAGHQADERESVNMHKVTTVPEAQNDI
jgi:hypothetical protein